VPPPPPPKQPGCSALGLPFLRCSDIGLLVLWLIIMAALWWAFVTPKVRCRPMFIPTMCIAHNLERHVTIVPVCSCYPHLTITLLAVNLPGLDNHVWGASGGIRERCAD
jgi:hypothetical protein